MVGAMANQRNLSAQIAGLVGAERAYCVQLSMLSKLILNFVYPPLFIRRKPHLWPRIKSGRMGSHGDESRPR